MKGPRLLFMAMPPPGVEAAILDVLRAHDLERRLGGALFAPSNWHQSLSERIPHPTPGQIETLKTVGRQVSAHACTLQYNRIDSSVNAQGNIHVTLHAKGRPKAFDELTGALQRQLIQAGQQAIATGTRPHTTLSYSAPSRLDRIEIAPCIRWTIDELRLVIGDRKSDCYRYEIVDRWRLLPEVDRPATQPALF